MKKSHFIIGFMLSWVLSTFHANAQSQEFVATKGNPEFSSSYPSRAVSSTSSVLLSKEEVPVKAFKSLKKYYDKGDEKWIKTSFGYVSIFKADSASYRISYDKKGRWLASVKSYKENKFNKEARAQLKREYYDYNILKIYEIDHYLSRKGSIYLVVIESATKIKWIRINDGTVDEYKSWSKS